MRRAVFVFLAGLALEACGAPKTSPRESASPPDSSAATAAQPTPFGDDSLRITLLEADREFARSTAEYRIGGWMSHFSTEGLIVAGGRIHAGDEAVRRVMVPVFRDTTLALEWEPRFAAVSEAGDLGYTIGTYTTRRGNQIDETGAYLTVWRRDRDGRWKVEADIGNPAQP